MFNMLGHWREENSDKEFRNTDSYRFAVFDETSKTYQNYDMSDFKDQVITKADYTKYTVMDVGSYYLTFIVGILLHYFIVTILMIVSNRIHGRKVLSFDIVIQIFSSLVLPEV